MDEYNNQNENQTTSEAEVIPQDAQATAEAVYEQRPSQKYGRTAYQQQMSQQNDGTQYQQNGNGNPYQQYQQNGNGNPYQQYQQNGSGNPYQQYQQNGNGNPYQQYQQNGNGNPYQQYQQYGNGNPYQQPYTAPRQPRPEMVKDVFCYLLMTVTAFAFFISAFTSIHAVNALEGFTGDFTNYTQLYSYLATVAVNPVVSLLANLLSVAGIIFVVLDIVTIYKANYKVTGLILFAIFLRPAYWIWRSHVVGRKKLLPILYTVIYYLLTTIELVWIYIGVFQMIARVML